MPSKGITDHQVNKYKEYRRQHGQEAAAARAGVSVRTARRIEQMTQLPSQRPPRQWRTREDPLGEVWDTQVVPLLRAAPGLTAVTLLEELQRRFPGEYGESVLRTLQRRIRRWRALEGAEREVFFAQAHEPGRQGLSDFTDAGQLGVQIAGKRLDHRLYQFALAYSGWRHVEVVLGGESFVALSAGLQNALWALGGVPAEHRTDSLSAAFRNLSEKEDLTRRYEALCEHYGMRASRNNRGASHENGSIEARNGSVKHFIEQALLLRSSRRFDDLEQYRQFIAEVVARANARVAKGATIERACLARLPARRTTEYEEVDARVTKFAIFTVRGAVYSAPSRLIGHRLKVRVYAERIEAYLGDVRVVSAERATGRGRVIDYRHMLPALKRKPNALVRWRLRDALFPRTEYQQTWQHLIERLPENRAARIMVGLLDLAASAGCEVALARTLGKLLRDGELPDLDALTRKFKMRTPAMPVVDVQLPSLAQYDSLMQAA
jgi:transposase InsO family protein